MDKPINDNNAFNGALLGSDAHGQAALLLVESLIHGLIARNVISVEDAVETISVAIETAEESSSQPENSHVALQKSLTMLKAIGRSLSHDL